MAEKRYNFKLSPQRPTSEQIARHRDFDALLSTYEQSRAASNGSGRIVRAAFWLAAACAAALVGILLYQTVLTSSTSAADAYFASQPYINPPIDLPANYAEQVVQAENGGVFEHPTGSKVIIPPGAFITGKGSPVNGEVDIRYREFHDYVDFFASGIPMEYDSAGQRYLLESIGMIEIYAEQKGERLNLAPGKSIQVELVSEITLPVGNSRKIPSYNVYRLSEAQRNWIYEGVDQIDLLGESELLPNAQEQIELDYKNALRRIDDETEAALARIDATIPRPPAPLKPEQPKEDAYVFDLEFTDNQIEDEVTRQELRTLRQQYGHMMWQVGANNPGFDQEKASTVAWEDMRLRKINEEEYELKLMTADQKMTMTVKPVLTGNDYQRALQKYQNRLADYQQQMTEREAKLKDQKEEVLAKSEVEKARARKLYKEQLEGIQTNPSEQKVRQRIRSRFVANRFGIWNCDRPIQPFAVAVSGDFRDDNSNRYNENTAYLVNKEKNTICRFYTGKGGEVKLDQDGKHMLWVVTPENKIALMRPEELRINRDKDDYTFQMKVIDKKIETEADLRRVLTF